MLQRVKKNQQAEGHLVPYQNTVHIRQVLFLIASTYDAPGGSVHIHYLSTTLADYVNIQLGGEQPPFTELSISYLHIYLSIPSGL